MPLRSESKFAMTSGSAEPEVRVELDFGISEGKSVGGVVMSGH